MLLTLTQRFPSTKIIHNYCRENHITFPHCRRFLCVNFQVRQNTLDLFNQLVETQQHQLEQTRKPSPLWTTTASTTQKPSSPPSPSEKSASEKFQGIFFILFLIFLSVSIFTTLAACACCLLYSESFKSCRDCFTCARFIRGVLAASETLHSCVVPEQSEEEEVNEREMEEMNEERRRQQLHEEAANQLNLLEERLNGEDSNPILRPRADNASSISGDTNSTLVDVDLPPASPPPPPPPPSSPPAISPSSSSSSPPTKAPEEK